MSGVTGLDKKAISLSSSVEQKLLAFRTRLVEAQRTLILQAAHAECLPSFNALRQIADLENTIVATDTMIEEEREDGK